MKGSILKFCTAHQHHLDQPEPDGVRPSQAVEVSKALLRPHLLLPLPDTEVFTNIANIIPLPDTNIANIEVKHHHYHQRPEVHPLGQRAPQRPQAVQHPAQLKL